ncbi:MAG: transposase [cyanobacterium endosymbiont of Rhopalodia musculus]
MKHKLVELIDKILLSKYLLIGTVNDQLKNISKIENFRDQSV